MQISRIPAMPAAARLPARAPAPSCSQAFHVELQNAIRARQADALDLMSQRPAACSTLDATQLGEVLLTAVKLGHGEVVDLLSVQTTPAQRMAIPPDSMLELVEAARQHRGSETETVALLDALFREAPDCQARLDDLAANAQNEGKTLLASALCDYKAQFKLGSDRHYSQARQNIYLAASRGDAALLQDLLDDELGIPRRDDALVGFPWLLNTLHRWMMGLVAAPAARKLVNEPAGAMPLLQAAVASGDLHAVEVLLEKGADASIKDRQGRSLLMPLAEGAGNLDLARLLCKHGAGEIEEAGMKPSLPGEAAAGPGLPGPGAAAEDMAWRQFRRLLPDAAGLLDRSGPMARALNLGEDMLPQQLHMLRASFLAQFDPASLRSMDDDGAAASNEAAATAAQLWHHCFGLVDSGKRLEASIGADIRRVLDSQCDEFADDPSHDADSVRRSLGHAGLCSLLIARVSAALETARNRPGWRSAGSRRGVFINELRVQLGHRHIAASGRNASGSSGDPGMFGMLLQSQAAVLGSDCAGGSRAGCPGCRHRL